MKNIRRRFERFCVSHASWGIPNLMMWIALGNLVVFFLDSMDPSHALLNALLFDPYAILKGQIWRLVTYAFTFLSSFSAFGLILSLLVLYFTYSMGRSVEQVWGTFRFNAYFFLGIALTDLVCLVFKSYADTSYIQGSIFLAFATLFPDATFLIMFIIPVKARWLAIVDLVLTAWAVFSGLIMAPLGFSYLIPLAAISNYLLFFGKDVLRLLPMSWQVKLRRSARPSKTIPFPNGAAQRAKATQQTHPAEKPYTHKCTVCGRTDVSNPELEFRYCSRCSGYHCYCMDHINNHAHIQQ